MTQTTDRLVEVLDCDRRGDVLAILLKLRTSRLLSMQLQYRLQDDAADLIQSLAADLDKAQSQLVDAEQRIAELEEGIRSALTCTPTIGREYVGIAGMPYRNVIQYDCGNPWDILRAALNQPKESGNEG